MQLIPLGNKQEAGSSTGRDTCQRTPFVPVTAKRSQGERTQCHRLLSARTKLALTLQELGEGVSEQLLPESQGEQGPQCHLPPSHRNKRNLVILPCTACAGGGGEGGASACRQRALPSPLLWGKGSKQIKPPQPGTWAERDSNPPMGGLCSEREAFQQHLGTRLCRLREHRERTAELIAPEMGEQAKHRSREPT